jgi:hypothetical protein
MNDRYFVQLERKRKRVIYRLMERYKDPNSLIHEVRAVGEFQGEAEAAAFASWVTALSERTSTHSREVQREGVRGAVVSPRLVEPRRQAVIGSRAAPILPPNSDDVPRGGLVRCGTTKTKRKVNLHPPVKERMKVSGMAKKTRLQLGVSDQDQSTSSIPPDSTYPAGTAEHETSEDVRSDNVPVAPPVPPEEQS